MQPATLLPTPASTVERYSEADVPTEYGLFRVVVYRDSASGDEHTAIIAGDVRGADGVLARVHSECFTGEVLHSLKCDCREQLDVALRRIASAGRGVVVYLRQEGRGIGLGNKIRAYALQSRGLDTVDANRALGFADDLRRYHEAAMIFDDLGVRSVALMTNNPAKLDAMRDEGVRVTSRVPILVEPNPHSRGYIATKRMRMGHLDAQDPGPAERIASLDEGDDEDRVERRSVPDARTGELDAE